MDRRSSITSALADGLGASLTFDRLISAAQTAGTKVLRIGCAAPV